MRRSSPSFLQALWDGIEQSGFCKTDDDGYGCVAPLKKLKTYIQQKLNFSEERILTELQRATEDDLVVSYATRKKRHAYGNESDLYGLPGPEELTDRGDHDWYCFKCNLGQANGCAVWCTTCPRIYHDSCLNADEKMDQKDRRFISCSVCKTLTSRASADQMKITQQDLNILVKYSCLRFFKWGIPMLNHADGRSWAKESGRDEAKCAWRYDRLVYSSIDLSAILKKAEELKYTSLEEYWVDCSTLVHNVAVYFGCDALNDMERTGRFQKSFNHDLMEIQLCPDCFRHSNELKPNWFALPCSNPHEAVWAKISGYPYWPAKVMKEDINDWTYDVRFFGGQHERALKVTLANIKPIHTSPTDLRVGIQKRTAEWKKACEELKKFQQLASASRNVRNEEITDATVTNGTKGINNNNFEAVPTQGGATKREKSVRFAIPCSSTADQLHSGEDNEDSTLPETTNDMDAHINGFIDDSPQSLKQGAGCLAEESKPVHVNGQGSLMGAPAEDSRIYRVLQELQCCQSIDERDLAIMRIILEKMKGCMCAGCLDRMIDVAET